LFKSFGLLLNFFFFKIDSSKLLGFLLPFFSSHSFSWLGNSRVLCVCVLFLEIASSESRHSLYRCCVRRVVSDKEAFILLFYVILPVTLLTLRLIYPTLNNIQTNHHQQQPTMAAALQQQQPSFTYNPFNPSCSALPCLQQVVGYTHNDAAEQLASCSSIFGYPVVSTVTLAVPPVYSTDISTSTYISISVSTSVATSTYESVSTSTGYIVVVQTDYTTTVVNTIISTAAASVLPEETFTKRSPSPERRLHRRCKGRPSSSSSVVPSSSVSVEACANLQAYASACACLDPEPVTVYASASTSVIPSTTVETIPSTSGTVVTSVLTSVVVQQDFATITSVLQSYTETTTTTTTTTSSSTTAPPPPIETLAFAASSSQLGVGGSLVFSGAGGQLSWSAVPAGSGSQFVLENGAMRLQISSIYKFRVGASAASASFGQVWIITDANVASKPTTEWYTPACSVHPTTRELTCATSNGLSVWWLCSSVVYLASPGTTFAQCSQVTIKATT